MTSREARDRAREVQMVEERMRERERKRKQKDFESALKADALMKRIKGKEKKRMDKSEVPRGSSTKPQFSMVLVLDSTLTENSDFMEALVEELEEEGIGHTVGQGGPVGCVRWRRIERERTVTDDGQIGTERDENYLLLTLEAHGFAGLVHYSKMAELGGTLPVGSETLQGYIETVKRENEGVTVFLAVEGMDAYFRGNKTKVNRRFRKHVLGAGSSSSAAGLPEVTWLDCQEAILGLQLLTGSTVRLCQGPEQLAECVLTLTKAISEKPFRKKSPFSFHPDVAKSKKRVASGSDQQTSTSWTWKNQLMQFNNLSEVMASAVVAAYPTPAHLLSAYSSCDDQSAALLLQDITVRRGVGTVASTRRLGPVLSRRIHHLLTTGDPHVTIT